MWKSCLSRRLGQNRFLLGSREGKVVLRGRCWVTQKTAQPNLRGYAAGGGSLSRSAIESAGTSMVSINWKKSSHVPGFFDRMTSPLSGSLRM